MEAENNSVNEKHIKFSILKIDGIKKAMKMITDKNGKELSLIFQYGENTQNGFLRKKCNINENGEIDQKFIIQYIKNQQLSFTLSPTKFDTMLIYPDYLLKAYQKGYTNKNKAIKIAFTTPNTKSQQRKKGQRKKGQRKKQQKNVELSLIVSNVEEGDVDVIHVDDRPLVVLDDIPIQDDANKDVRNEEEEEEKGDEEENGKEEESEMECGSFCCEWSWCDISDVSDEEIKECFKNVPTEDDKFEKYTGLSLKEWEKRLNDYGGDELHEKKHKWE